MTKFIPFLLLLSLSTTSNALSWQDLWQTHDQQAQDMMDKAQYKKAKDLFVHKDWQASANYRAGNYELAAKQFKQLNTASGFYNQGNALAHMGQYEQGIAAYEKALALNPNNTDAKYNKALLEKLLNQQKKHQKNQDKSKQDKNKQDKNKQDKNKQDKNKQDKNKQDKNKQDKNKQDKNKQDKNKQDKNKQDKSKQDKSKQDKNKQDKNKQDKSKQDKNKQPTQQANPKTKQQREQQQAKKQWLRQVPDDPGGLLKQKFLRDYLNKQQGWNQ